MPKYRQKGTMNVIWCGPHKSLKVLNTSENVKLDIPLPLDGLLVFNRGSRKPYIHRQGQQL